MLFQPGPWSQTELGLELREKEGKDWGSFKCDITSTCWELGVLIKMMRAWPAGMQSMRKAMLNSWPTNYFAFWEKNSTVINELLRFQSWLLTRWEKRSPEPRFDLGVPGFTDSYAAQFARGSRHEGPVLMAPRPFHIFLRTATARSRTP
jgi:hypothetical protein